LGEPSLAQQSSAANSAVASNSPPKDADSPDDENNTYLDEIRNDGLNVLDTIPRIDQLPVSVLSRMPAMVFAQHMYSSNDAQRWVRVNNRRLGEGDAIDQNVTIVRIEPQHVILSFQGREFKMNALSDW
jgi:general secretion pathway protein B